MELNRQGAWLLAVSALIVFVVVAVLLTRFLPEPHRDSDYLVVGAVSTLCALGVVFGTLLKRGGVDNLFFKKKK